jgi:hypothetical protein
MHPARHMSLGLVLCWFAASAGAGDLRGLATIGSAADHSRSDDFTASLDKSPFGLDVPTGRVVIAAESSPFGDFKATLVADADTQRSSVLDVQEAWVGWNPVPHSAWRSRAKLGAFFPLTSLEVGYEQVGWNPVRTISSSAINNWIAQEVRTIGAEFTQQWRGALLGVPHTFTLRMAVYGANDPGGTEIAWRGWDLSGRVTGLFQKLRLPDLPVYQPGGPIEVQTRNVHVFRELDHRPGWYGALGYAYEGVLDVEYMHYDNRADPLQITDRQYAWRTRFDHVGLSLQLPFETELLAQGMHGGTLMGPNGVHARFASWYLLGSHAIGPGRATVRYDWFKTTDRDIMPLPDPNGESGHAWAMAYSLPLPHSLNLVAEALRVDSRRDARPLIGEAPRRKENSVSMELRWAF